MDPREVARKVGRLPDHFADRVPAQTLARLRRMAEGGEYRELADELAAALAECQSPVTAAEKAELVELMTAMGLPTGAADNIEPRE